MNKKGDIVSILIAIVSIAIIGILIFFVSHTRDQLFTAFDDYFEESENYNNSEAQIALARINTVENAAWDYAFLGLAMGFFLALALTSFSTKISPIFYWIYGLISLIGLISGVILSNLWQELVANPEFATTITRFPITNALLGTYYPLFVTGLIVVSMILLFGKPPGADQ